ncbi:hypothetical protein PHSY_003594 [Pseudozyma hubeiensis SY62]|uniref:Uncharacterized protein n=1 Tax=Pseudozyma hubeiensis (strain SY62) TaxID=1305764 RepID=R9PD48_PSEHS|nr:hypothetical protein PHSY_003594 [Pseudozyma hubeiensis SY62]GAC96015.1 hypothetical protein PHSY_003594 [Pseudozyma hubeiensis SY62]
MNGLSGRIDYDAFESLISGLNQRSTDDATPMEVLEDTEVREADVQGTEGAESFSKHDELTSTTPNIDDSLRENPLDHPQESPSKKHKKDKKDRKEKKLKKESLP